MLGGLILLEHVNMLPQCAVPGSTTVAQNLKNIPNILSFLLIKNNYETMREATF